MYIILNNYIIYNYSILSSVIIGQFLKIFYKKIFDPDFVLIIFKRGLYL